MKVENMYSPNGNKVANQFIITDNGDEYFQSYKSIIAKRSKGKIYLDDYYWDYSTTTGKYRNQFLGEGIADTRKKIASGEYILTDLNSESKE
jgi:predicted transcriptional regulator|tara:strand:+ start:782 stop:1057 length:276 start_codon:yes stop_codon:yes gene_type:complete